MRKIVLMAITLAAVVSPAFAEPTRDEVMAGAERCYGIADNRTWLDCFYGSAQPMRGALGLPAAPVSQTRLVPPSGANYGPARPAARVAAPPPPPPERSGGFFADLIGSTKPVVSNMPMTNYKFDRDRTFTVTLQDGTVYRQLESDTVFASWRKDPSAYLVTINNSTGNTYALKVKGQPGISYRVQRR